MLSVVDRLVVATKRYLVLLLLIMPMISMADTVNIAVASNALSAIKYLSTEYTKQTGNRVNISSGSTGKLYAQIINGAPFDVFMAANSREPVKLEKQSLVVPGSRFTYAVGRLSICAYQPAASLTDIDSAIALLKQGKYNRLSIASPEVAPYGIAARQFLQKVALWDRVQDKLINGENINQAFRFVLTGNAQFGIVALSQVKQFKKHEMQCVAIPQKMYAPLKQQAVLLAHASENKAAYSFTQFMQQAHAQQVLLNKFGYDTVKEQ